LVPERQARTPSRSTHDSGPGQATHKNADGGFSFFGAIRNRLQQQPAAKQQDTQNASRKAATGRSCDNVLQMGKDINARQAAKKAASGNRSRRVTGKMDFSQVPDTLPVSDSEEDDRSVASGSSASDAGRRRMHFDQVPDQLPRSESGSDDDYQSDSQRSPSEDSRLDDHDITLDFSEVPDDLSNTSGPAAVGSTDDLGFADVPQSLDVPEEDGIAKRERSLGFHPERNAMCFCGSDFC
jgi:hypothetical protein